MIFIESLKTAVSTYSILPVPTGTWNGENSKYSICFLPLVGGIIAAAMLLLRALCARYGIHPQIYGAAAALLPLFLSGGIHMDGFMDTVDALSSHQSREKMLEILKDPHAGAFAILACGAYLLLTSAFYGAIYEAGAADTYAWSFLLSRAMAGLTVVLLPNARGSGMQKSMNRFTELPKEKRTACAALAGWTAVSAAMLLRNGRNGVWMLCAAILVLLWYIRTSLKHFGGTTGDTSGFFLTLNELCMAGAFYLSILF